MTVLKNPFYDPLRSYKENCEKGPFNDFINPKEYINRGEPKYDFLGTKLYLPFGIPAGPIPNSNFVKSAFKKGFDVIIYKTVRTKKHPCNEYPNIVPLKNNGKLTFKEAENGVEVDKVFKDPLAITNSFGVPSLSPEEWMEDLKKSVSYAKKGQLLIGSYQGTNRNIGELDFIEDWVLGAKLVKECGVKVIELNLSCPNEGKKNLLCHDTNMVLKIVKSVVKKVKNVSFLLKMPYFSDDNKLLDFISKLSPFIDGFDAINTIAGKIITSDGNQVLPGKGRLISGICGAPIKWAGLEMVKRINKIRNDINGDFIIIGTGGVINTKDYKEYIDAGADLVMSATGSMWNANLAKEIKEL
jgi:dihydroorotate dehydrogenase (NAD+) catalytic subunit